MFSRSRPSLFGVDPLLLILTVVLPAVAGAVNGSGFLALGRYTSHVTGNIAHAGDDLASGNFARAFDYVTFGASFFFGAVVATLMVLLVRGRRGRYAWPLLLEALVLLGFVALLVESGTSPLPNQVTLTSMLCFGMGLQNALVTRISGAVVRTTHLTGVTTDLGIAAAQFLVMLLGRLRGQPVTEAQRAALGPRVKLHLAIFVSFIVGACVGPFLWLTVGPLSLLAPVLTLLALAGIDSAFGLEEWKPVAS